DPDAAEVAVPVGGAVGGARPDDDDPEEGPPADGGAAEGRRGAGGPAGPERPVESIRGRGEARDAGAGGALRQDGRQRAGADVRLDLEEPAGPARVRGPVQRRSLDDLLEGEESAEGRRRPGRHGPVPARLAPGARSEGDPGLAGQRLQGPDDAPAGPA